MRDCCAPLNASPARSMSLSNARAKPHTVLSLMMLATACTASKSPTLAAGKPASMTLTFSLSKALAIRTFSSRVMDAPGLCSPSRKVVSNIINWSFIKCSVHGELSTARLISIKKRGVNRVDIKNYAR